MNILILRSPGDKQVAKLQCHPYKNSDFRAVMPAENLHYFQRAPFGSRGGNISLPVLGGVREETQASRGNPAMFSGAKLFWGLGKDRQDWG